MFIHPTRLKHLATPDCYYSPDRYAREMSQIFMPGWHLVGSLADVPNDYDFMTLELLGHPLQIRKIDGEIHAFSNVCAHRHCLLSDACRGSSPKIRCQYHGWEYDKNGRTGHIPEPKSFPPFDREVDRLAKYRVGTCGQLIFVNLSESGPAENGRGLAETLGATWACCEDWFSDEWRQIWTWEADFPANWKIPVENSLEGYHAQCVHPTTFKKMPPENMSQHELTDRYTRFSAANPASDAAIDRGVARYEQWLKRRLGGAPQGRYTHYHHFPNLLLSGPDMVHLAYAVFPTSATTCHGTLRVFMYQGRRPGPVDRLLSRQFAVGARAVVRKVMAEDESIFPAVQRGMEAANRPGVLGRMEERIFVFQEYLQRTCDAVTPPPAATKTAVPTPAIAAPLIPTAALGAPMLSDWAQI